MLLCSSVTSAVGVLVRFAVVPRDFVWRGAGSSTKELIILDESSLSGEQSHASGGCHLLCRGEIEGSLLRGEIGHPLASRPISSLPVDGRLPRKPGISNDGDMGDLSLLALFVSEHEGAARIYLLEGESASCEEAVPEEEMCTVVVTSSPLFKLPRGDTVTSVLCVTKDVGLKGCTIRVGLQEDSTTELQLERVCWDRLAHSEKMDSETISRSTGSNDIRLS
jgi:hypothetical protein